MHRVQRVLFPIDLSGPWRMPPEPLRSVIERSGAEITLLHAVDPQSRSERGNALPRSMAQMEFIARRDFPGKRVTRRFERGRVTERILEHIRSAEVDLVVLPARNRPAAGRSPLGHVAREVLSEAPCGVWLEWPGSAELRNGAQNGPVCCSIDGTESDSYLMQEAARWACELAAPLTIVQPLWAPPGKSTSLFCDPHYRSIEVGYAETRIERLRRQFGVKADLEVEIGIREIVLGRAVQTSHARLLVTGDHEAALAAEGICPVWRMPRVGRLAVPIPAPKALYAAASGRAS
jgi:nucleotide-binding universal stress UspA family protein